MEGKTPLDELVSDETNSRDFYDEENGESKMDKKNPDKKIGNHVYILGKNIVTTQDLIHCLEINLEDSLPEWKKAVLAPTKEFLETGEKLNLAQLQLIEKYIEYFPGQEKSKEPVKEYKNSLERWRAEQEKERNEIELTYVKRTAYTPRQKKEETPKKLYDLILNPNNKLHVQNYAKTLIHLIADERVANSPINSSQVWKAREIFHSDKKTFYNSINLLESMVSSREKAQIEDASIFLEAYLRDLSPENYDLDEMDLFKAHPKKRVA